MSKINQNFFLGAHDNKECVVKLLEKLSGSNNKQLRKIMLDIFLKDKEYDIKYLKNEILLEICNNFYNIGLEKNISNEIIEKIGYKRDYDCFIEGGTYQPVFAQSAITIADFWIDKYQVTQDKWKEIMRTDSSDFKDPRRPVGSVSWLGALEFCNKMSKKYGLQPVYKIENGALTKVIHSDGEEVYPNLADFTNTEGYRLPTELEWEWAARGGETARQDETFNFKYSGSDSVGEVAWYDANLGKQTAMFSFLTKVKDPFYDDNQVKQTHDVGGKKPNQLGLYDMSGNVWEWCYDSESEGDISEDKPYIYDGSVSNRRVKGGSWNNGAGSVEVASRHSCDLAKRYTNYGFRVCRTV